MHRPDVDQERCGQAERDRPDQIDLHPVEDIKDDRKQNIKLFLDTKRPEMQKRLRFRRAIEISGLGPQGDVRDECGTGNYVLTEIPVIVRQKNKIPQSIHTHDDSDEGRKYSFYPARIKFSKTESAFKQAIHDDRGYQESGNDEKYIDADKAAAKIKRRRMKCHNGKNRDSPQAVDVPPIPVMHDRRNLPNELADMHLSLQINFIIVADDQKASGKT